MKLDSNTEMDRLLRRHARRADSSTLSRQDVKESNDGEAATSGRAAMSGGGAHLDADELNAYAENALPAAARARYTAHLIDCRTCRRLATELALAANIPLGASANVVSQGHVTPEKTWRERLARFFAPPALRYAVPALALICVAVIAFVVMRNRQDSSPMVARNEQAASNNSAATVTEQKTELQDQGASATTTTTTATSGAATQTSTDKPPGAIQSGSPTIAPSDERNAQASANPTTPATKNVEPSSPAAETESSDSVAEQQQQARSKTENKAAINRSENSTATAAPPPVASSDSSAQRTTSNTTATTNDTVAARRSTRERDANESSTTGTAEGAGAYANQTDQSSNRASAARSSAAAPPPNVRGRNIARKPSTAAAPADNRNAARDNSRAGEMRSVAGRQFRREGSVWIDTAYDSSRSLTNVARGSEQFRALVADEPAIRTIANQLGGEVIVVWKGRAYRIR